MFPVVQSGRTGIDGVSRSTSGHCSSICLHRSRSQVFLVLFRSLLAWDSIWQFRLVVFTIPLSFSFDFALSLFVLCFTRSVTRFVLFGEVGCGFYE